MDGFSMNQDWNEIEGDPWREPSISRADASLDLFQYHTGFQSSALQLDRRHPGGTPLFADEKIVAPFLMGWDGQRVAFLHVHNDAHGRQPFQTDLTTSPVAASAMAANWDSLVKFCYRARHSALLPWMRLKIFTFSLYRASLTAS